MFAYPSLWPERADTRLTPLTVFLASSVAGFLLITALYFFFVALGFTSDANRLRGTFQLDPRHESLPLFEPNRPEPSFAAEYENAQTAQTTGEETTASAPRAIVRSAAKMTLPIIGSRRLFVHEETNGSGAGDDGSSDVTDGTGGDRSATVAALDAGLERQGQELTPQPATESLPANKARSSRATKQPSTTKRYAKPAKHYAKPAKHAKPTRIAQRRIERRRAHFARSNWNWNSNWQGRQAAYAMPRQRIVYPRGLVTPTSAWY